jgi:glutamate dehydrogenase
VRAAQARRRTHLVRRHRHLRAGLDETNADVGDRTNDAIRVTARELNAKVIGEGANLAITQRARIEFALRGGRINTDAVDNSAGVNSSDMEVNIKIALSPAEAKRAARPEGSATSCSSR